jgi:hypothetical protein
MGITCRVEISKYVQFLGKKMQITKVVQIGLAIYH